ncbi:MAG: Rhs family protein, partial [bacterium]
WSMSYDTQGNMTSSIDPLNHTSTMTYDGIGRVLSMSDPLGRTSSMIYDAMSRVISQTDPAGAINTFTYDPNGNQMTVTNAVNNTWTVAYDTSDRIINKKYPLTPSDNGVQREMRVEYNLNDEIISLFSPSNRSLRYSYDDRGQRKTIKDPLGNIIAYEYDMNRNLTSLTDQRGNTTSWEYDELYRATKLIDSLGKTSRINYDTENNITSFIDRLNRSTSIMHDELDRPIQVQYVDAIVKYQYDAAGRRTRIDDTQFGGSFIAWAYDNANRLLSETTLEGTVSYTYNIADERTSMTAIERPTVTYLYDNAGRLSTINQDLGQLEIFTYNYDILSRRISLQRPNSITTTYSYDQNNRLVRLKHNKDSNLIIEDFQYTYNIDDEIASISSLFSNPLLTQDVVSSQANSVNRISQTGNAFYSFDDMGQILSKTVNGTETTTYSWDHRGRLTGINLPNGQTISHLYDALRRKTTTINGDTTKFVYDLNDIVIDINSDGTKIDYLNGEGIDEHLRQSNSSLGDLYFLQDHLGSTIALSSLSGSIVENIKYDTFGNTESINSTRYGYSGREHDLLSNLIYYRTRWYDPKQGRFLTEDLKEFEAGINFYVYGKNNPILYSDPFGLMGKKPSRL